MPKKTRAIKKTDLKQKKSWLRKQNNSEYRVEEVEPNKIILIVCEGQTEKLYFESFPVYGVRIHFENTKGQTKQKLIEITSNKVKSSRLEYDYVWCVFDMDVKEGKKEYSDFDNAIKAGRKKGYNIAYSNDAFELWFYLHFQYSERKEHRAFYYKELSKVWGINYIKEGKKLRFSRSIYGKLLNDKKSSQKQAIRNAKKLFGQNKQKLFHQQNPVTTVYQLVEYLNANLKR